MTRTDAREAIAFYFGDRGGKGAKYPRADPATIPNRPRRRLTATLARNGGSARMRGKEYHFRKKMRCPVRNHAAFRPSFAPIVAEP